MTAKKTPALKASANKATSSQHTAPNTSANTANEALIQTLKARFEAHPKRHPNMAWQNVEARLSAHPDKLKVLQAMEDTGGEPDVVAVDHKTGELTFVDCSAETPAGRRSVCYDAKALASRKENLLYKLESRFSMKMNTGTYNPWATSMLKHRAG
jgi:hypothetical protein